MKRMRNRLQKAIVALIVGWLTLFVLLPNLMIFVTSFLTRDDAHFVSMVFTLNNYGVHGVDGSTPIINHPETGMLGVGRIVDKPWVHKGRLRVRKVTQFSFTFDHRVCDGGTAGGFLRFVADCVEEPATLLTEV